MTISLEKIGKRYNYDWIFRGIDFTFEPHSRYAILGPNGSGKSTLLQMLAGSLQASEGSVSYTRDDGQPLTGETVFHQIGLAAPYLEVVEEFSLLELLRFHEKFKPFLAGLGPRDVIRIVGLEASADKPIRLYSSGMKQRVKLAQAIFSDTPILLLDEPCTNLDEAGVRLYHTLLTEYAADRLLVVSSNDPKEYEGCDRHLSIPDYKH